MKKPPVFALIDCNNFFASCERVFRPDLWQRPVAVLSNNDGCIIARSDEVKAMGVPMGIPLFKVAGVLKQHGTALFSANFSLYGDMSQRITEIVRQQAPHIEVYSIDESFVSLGDLAAADYGRWAREVRAKVLQQTGIPVSIGIGPTKTLAKAAAEYAKKTQDANIHVAIEPAVREALLKWLDVGDVWGVGRRLAPRLRDAGISHAWQLSRVSDEWALKEMTVKGLSTVKELQGEAVFTLEREASPRKTIGRSRSFGHTVRDYHQLESAVATFTAQAAAKLRAQESVCGGIVSYLRTRKHSDNYRSLATVTALAEPTADTGRLITAALQGLEKLYDPDFGYAKAGVVLIGVSSIREWQLSLLYGEGQRDKRLKLMKAVDALNKTFGPSTVWHASQDSGRAAWHSKHERRSPAYTTAWSDVPLLGV